jgi:hypothetical protein
MTNHNQEFDMNKIWSSILTMMAKAHGQEGEESEAPPSDGLALSSIAINKDYAKKWNAESYNDFKCLSLNGEMIRPTLYRVGGMNYPELGKDRFFMLLKYVEAFYNKNITDHTGSDPKHLEGRWCILDRDGNEKVEFKSFDSPYLVKDSCIYSINSKYYNIETGEFYCHAYSSMQSSDFLFLDNPYDKDKSKRGVMKISKADGTWELFSCK